MRDHAGASYPVLADPGGQGAASPYGVFNLLGDGVAAPATLIIADGQIAASHYGQDIGERTPAAAIIHVLRDITGVPQPAEGAAS